jgi:hypothetical protein
MKETLVKEVMIVKSAEEVYKRGREIENGTKGILKVVSKFQRIGIVSHGRNGRM